MKVLNGTSTASMVTIETLKMTLNELVVLKERFRSLSTLTEGEMRFKTT
jgi:hypothetical protein